MNEGASDELGLAQHALVDNNDARSSFTLTKSGKLRKPYHRMVYSAHQSTCLLKVFSTKKFLTLSERSALSDELGLSEPQIKIWFQVNVIFRRSQVKMDIFLLHDVSQ